MYTSTASALTSDLPVATPGASATVRDRVRARGALPQVFSKRFGRARVGLGEDLKLRFFIENTANFLDVSALAFSDTLPAGMVVFDAGFCNCGGTLTAPVGGNTITFTGGSVEANKGCNIVVFVRAPLVADTTSDLTSGLPFSSTRSVTAADTAATLRVTDTEPPLSVSMAFTPSMIT